MAPEQPAGIDTEFRAFVIFNGNKFEPTVSELLGSSGEPWREFANMKSQTRSPSWIWFHLPAVNLDWLQKLGSQLRCAGITQTWDGDRDTHQGRNQTVGEGVERPKDGILSFLEKAFAGDTTVDFPNIGSSQGSEDVTFSVAMPFLDSENSEEFNDSNNKIARLKVENRSYDGREVIGLIVSRTLDESLYVASNSTATLDRDQVVRRYYKSQGEIQPRILMVSPLRLWKIGCDVVITAFPSNWEVGREFDSTALGHVYQSVTRSRPASSMKLVSQILASVITVMDGPNYAGLRKNPLGIFEAEMLDQKTKQLELYQRFRRFVAEKTRPASNSRPRPSGEAYQPFEPVAIVNDEMECFRIVMDIRDELEMISSVISEQERVFQSVARTIQKLTASRCHSTNATRDQPYEVELGIMRWKSRISNIDQRAQVVEKALSHLLGLKIEVSNLVETELSREFLARNGQLFGFIARLQTASAEEQARAAQQSRYLFAFTVVTVVFAPLSFVASFFAILSRDFPQDGGVSWSQSQIGGGLDLETRKNMSTGCLP